MSDPPTTLRTDRLVIERLGPQHAARMVAFLVRNGEHLAATSPPRPEGFLTEAYWRDLGEQQAEPFDTTRKVAWVSMLHDEPQRIVGSMNLNEIIRGAFRSCFLGYSLDHEHVGRGLMTEGLRAVIDHAFEHLRLNRISANHVPDNHRSAAVLRRLGFVREGYSEGYLFIAGAWRDHVLTALRNPRPPTP